MIFNIRLTAATIYFFLPAIHIMDLSPVGDNNFVNWGYNSLILILCHAYLLGNNVVTNLRNSVYYFHRMIVWYFTRVIPIVWVLASDILCTVFCGCGLDIHSHVSTICMCISSDTASLIMVLLCMNKNCDSCYNHRLVFTCDPNCTLFYLLFACLCDPLIDSVLYHALPNWTDFTNIYWRRTYLDLLSPHYQLLYNFHLIFHRACYNHRNFLYHGF